jgi:hypothetical protein
MNILMKDGIPTNQSKRPEKPLRVYYDKDLDAIVQHCMNPSRRDNPIKLRRHRIARTNL